MEQCNERRQEKRPRELDALARTLVQVQTWSVDRIKGELTKRGLCTSGLKHNLVPQLAAAMVDEGGGEREEARPRICMRER